MPSGFWTMVAASRPPGSGRTSVFRRCGAVLAVADAKYKNRHEHPPSVAELYQLCTYGLVYGTAEPAEVLLLHPLVRGEPERPTTLLFAPSAVGTGVRIRLVGVPVDGLLDGSVAGWWPWPPGRPERR